ncbi:hypothetical protein OKA04_04625 [Luteolibacter flavescens]|uniref:Holin n=1 Tax=Luteolibacter flavescens TaxID=1859460 RepID=A0ABT3FL80_9BACT|nr:hypothetical protein [Luteolibacter flavescens]MCW1884001.1 hypothetical protein [Luteolibacter flavescens]
MKEKLGSLIQGLAIALGSIGTFLEGQNLIAPEDVAAVNNAGGSIAAALGIILAAIIMHVIGSRIKKSGVGNSGGNLPAIALTMTVALSMVGALPSCSVVSSAVTGAPIPATSVQRADQPGARPFLVASADVAQAEAEADAAEQAGTKPPIHGLYDAGRAATAVREVFTESSK